MAHYLVVIVTTSTKKEATKIIQSLLKEKSHSKLFDKLSKKVKEIHSYEVPEILALPILKGSSSYLNWLEETLQSEK